MFRILAQHGCDQVFKNGWQYTVFMNDLWTGLCREKDVAARVVAEEARKRPHFVGPVRTVLESLRNAYATARNARIWGEKTPGHLLFLPHMYRLFPEARIIVTLRDPRDILLSYDDRWGHGQRNTKFLMEASAVVRHYFEHLRTIAAYPSEQICRVRYESLVSCPKDVLTSLCSFLDVEFEPGMLEFYRSHQIAGRDGPDREHHRLLSRPVTSERVGRYKAAFSATQIQLIEEFFGEHLGVHGYERESEGHCILTREDRDWQARGRKRFEQMRSGTIRRRLFARARLRLRAFRWLASLPRWAFSRLAITASDWEMRASRMGQAEAMGPHRVSLRHVR